MKQRDEKTDSDGGSHDIDNTVETNKNNYDDADGGGGTDEGDDDLRQHMPRSLALVPLSELGSYQRSCACLPPTFLTPKRLLFHCISLVC